MDLAKLFLTGDPGVGKTTLIRKVVRDLQNRGIAVDGMTSSEIRQSGSRVGFQIEDVSNKSIGELARLDHGSHSGASVGRYVVNVGDIEKVGVVAIRRALECADVVVIDEVGPMELKSSKFVLVVQDLLASRKNCLCSLHKRSSHPVVEAIRRASNCQIIELTRGNRELMELQLLSRLAC